jgi:hypothetical protein
MILPFPVTQISDEERQRVLVFEQKNEIEAQKLIIRKLQERLDAKLHRIEKLKNDRLTLL